jgi:hypothetical protein
MGQVETIQIDSMKDVEKITRTITEEIERLKTQILKDSKDLNNLVIFAKDLLANSFDATVRLSTYIYESETIITIYKDTTKVGVVKIPKDTPASEIITEILKRKQILFNQVLTAILDIVVKFDEINVYNRLDKIEYKLERVLKYLDDP